MKIWTKAFLMVLILLICGGCSVQGKGVKVYFFKQDKLIAVTRELPTLESPALIAIDQLMRGLNEQDQLNGLTTFVPQGTRAIEVLVDGDVAIVDLNERMAAISADDSMKMLAQIVYTATSVPGIKKVILKLQGNDNFKLPNDFAIDHPLERSDVKI